MTHGNPHDEAEHAAHHASDPFDKRIAMSMVVIAAVLATVKVIGHRTHNETLAYQIKSGVAHTQESDKWNFFQSKKMREVLARQEAKLLMQGMTPGKPVTSPNAALPNRDKRIAALTKEFTDEDVPKPTKAAEDIVAAAEKSYRTMLASGYAAAQAERVVEAELTAQRYALEGKAIAAAAKEKQDAAAAYTAKSDHKHHQADYFDLGELGVELALVLSSVAILTKRAAYWYSGLTLGVIGVVVAAMGFLPH